VPPTSADLQLVTPLQRFTILAAACVPLLAVALVVFLGLPLEPYQLGLVTVLATGGSTALLFHATRRSVALHDSAHRLRQILEKRQNDHEGWKAALKTLPPSEGGDSLVRLLHDLSSRLSAREAQLDDLINRITGAMTSIVHHRKIVSLEGLDLPTTQDRLVVFGAYREFIRTLVMLRRKARTTGSVLRHLPVAVAVADRAGRIQSMNIAAERLFGRKSNTVAGKPLSSFFANAAFAAANTAQLLVVQDGEEALTLLRKGEPREVFTTIRAAKGHTVLVGMRGFFGRRQIILFRERNPKAVRGHAKTADAETIPTATYLIHDRSPSTN
jgi:PAS domain S-box-containing protein